MTEKSTYFLETLTPDQLGKLLLHEFLSKDPDHQYIKNIISVGCPVDVRDTWKRTLLHWRCKAGQLDLVEFLLDNGFDIHARDRHDLTPLHCAVDECRLDIVRLLISRGADVNARSDYGWTALHYAACRGNLEVAELLISNGVLVNVKNNGGFTALHLALTFSDPSKVMDMIEMLISNGAEVNIGDNSDFTVLHWAAKDGKIEIMKFLISRGADVEARNKYGNTAWDMIAIQQVVPKLEPK